MSGGLSESFGFQSVTPEERESRIRRVFDAVAPRYDLMNDVMSFGIHRLWKRDMAKAAKPATGQLIVDLAGGTGDVARLLAGAGRRVVVCDPSAEMMAVGRARTAGTGVEFMEGKAEAMPFADASVDTVTIAFGLRNATNPQAGLAEIFRILKPGGRFLCLEFSRPWAVIRPFYDAFSFVVIPRLGAWVARQPMAYSYLVESIRRFPDQREMAALMGEAGFVGVEWRNLSAGIACLHQGVKP
ncbi:bifunctional demethylmenaquinone methyltransferase/2-methoxy-6-polyprenyl-1,4-benzoquinol methylase [Paramagnetospirillum kuznetsovii]|uniref:Ubiquinone/menaquinone biosynthesis C-methyltransferase UbiE n=1 Tax=Paramagnetospirillum kuznetsovii TaxID=2053833 RepID=A0A364NYG7_9PROT|nr:class I SAM-dependent methyltransferase [Paramagnetospirillum kuznetsovii]RAU22106.1 bifunctional demethylmenaquinone methyltransferase/2-methoxy-6-polyprenyl-1,4-benzoquinol methylase [Paramagnetospirillum kuznetsovii]